MLRIQSYDGVLVERIIRTYLKYVDALYTRLLSCYFWHLVPTTHCSTHPNALAHTVIMVAAS